jgi:hypothetical protein
MRWREECVVDWHVHDPREDRVVGRPTIAIRLRKGLAHPALKVGARRGHPRG